MTLLDALRRADEQATPGPWTTRGVSLRQVRDYVGGRPLGMIYDLEADAELIALARNVLPQLIELVEAARLVVEGEGFSIHDHSKDLEDALAPFVEEPPGDLDRRHNA